MNKKYKAVVVGLGNIGNLFDFEKERQGEIWTHTGAYLASEKVDLIAGVDPDKEKQDFFKDKRLVSKVYNNFEEMFKRETVDIVSICTPTQTHYEVVRKILAYPIKAVVIEKPLSYSLKEANELISTAKEKNVKVLVMYQRRYWNAYRKVKEIIDIGWLGEIVSVNGYYSSQVYNIGSHLFNTMSYFGGKIKWVSSSLTLDDPEDKTYTGTFGFENGAMGSFVPNNTRLDLVFEIDIFGEKGKIQIGTNGSFLKYWQYKPSTRYANYRELVEAKEPEIEIGEKEGILGAIEDLVDSLEKDREPVSSGEDALHDIEIINCVIKSAENKSEKFFIKDITNG